MDCVMTTPPSVYDGYELPHFGSLGDQLELAVAKTKSAIDSRECWLLYGPPGVGKSCLVAAFHRRLVAKHKLARWLECAMIPGDPVQAEEAMEEVTGKTAYVVFIEDLGREPPHHRGRMAKMLQERALMPARMDIITTNLNIDTEDSNNCELAELYGEHVRSRILGACRGRVVELNGDDFRTR